MEDVMSKYRCVRCGKTLKRYEIEDQNHICSECLDTYHTKVDVDTTQTYIDNNINGE